MTVTANRLKKIGFVTIAGADPKNGDYLDVVLSSEDAKVITSAHKRGGLKAVDTAIQRFGSLLLEKLGDVSKSLSIDGYWIDKETQKIAVRIVKADDGGATEKVNDVSERESIKGEFVALHDSMVTMRTKPSGKGDADITEKPAKVRMSAKELRAKIESDKKTDAKDSKKVSVKTVKKAQPDEMMSDEIPGGSPMDAPMGGDVAPEVAPMDTTPTMPGAEGEMPGSIDAFEEAQKNFTDYLTTNVPVDKAVGIATDIYEQHGEGSGEASEADEPDSELETEPEEVEEAPKMEEESDDESSDEKPKQEKTESIKKTESHANKCLRFRRLALRLKTAKNVTAETKEEVDEVIDEAMIALNENVSIEEATKIMQDAMSGNVGAEPEVAPEVGGDMVGAPDAALASLKKKVQKAGIGKKAQGFDIVTDTYSGKPEGKPEWSVKDESNLSIMPGYNGEPKVEDIVHANEKPKVPAAADKPEMAQEAMKKAISAFKAVNHMVDIGSISESQREEEFINLMKLNSADFSKVVSGVRKLSGKAGEFFVDSQFADVTTMFND